MFRYHYLILLIIGFDLVYADSNSETSGNKNNKLKHLIGHLSPSDFNGDKISLTDEDDSESKSLTDEGFESEEGKGSHQSAISREEKDQEDNLSEGSDQQDNKSAGNDQQDSTPEAQDQKDNTPDKPDSLFIRPLQTGDTFTPKDLLPLTRMLLGKVENPGEGKGIVTSSKSPEELADKIFAGFFLTKKMIVMLLEQDLDGLDALQALALDNTAVTDTRQRKLHTIDYHGVEVDIEDKPKRCRLTLLHKKESPPTTSLEPGLRSRHRKRPITPPPGTILKLEKNMKPKRHLILNHRGRKSNKGKKHIQRDIDPDYNDEDKKSKQSRESGGTKKKGKERKPKNNKKSKRNRKSSKENTTKKPKKKAKRNNNKKKNEKVNKNALRAGISITSSKDKSGIERNGLTTTMKPVCTWRYICVNPMSLDTCKLHTSCLDDVNNTPKIDKAFVDYEAKKKLDEENRLNTRFRKMFGLSLLDEEVEKIIEAHVVNTHPDAIINEPLRDRIESLDEYFTRIIMYQNTQLSTPKPPSSDNSGENGSSSEVVRINVDDQDNNKNVAGLYRWKKSEILRAANDKPANKTSVTNKEEKKSILRAPVSTTTTKLNTRPRPK